MLTNATLSPGDADHAIRPRSALHVIADMSADHGGNVRALVDLCDALNGVGVGCEIASLRHPHRGDSRSVLTRATEVHLFHSIPPRRLGNSMAFARWFRRNVRRYDLVEIHEIFRVTSIIAAVIAHRNGVPYLVHPHGSLDPFDLRKHRRAKRTLAPLFRRLLLMHARGIVFTSAQEQGDADTFSSRAPRFHLPPAIRPDALQGHRARLRTALSLADDTFLLLFMSRIDYKKGLLRTLRALRILADADVPIELVIAGSGEPAYERRVRDEVARLRLGRVVHFVGFLDGQAKADALAAADALILVSDNENFGIIVIEALRAGLPVIISDRIAIAGELVRAGAASVVAPEEQAIAKALREAVDLDVTARLRWSETAVRVADLLYDCDSVTRRHLALRRRVASTSAPHVEHALVHGETLHGAGL